MVSCSVSDVAKLCTKVLAVLALEMLVVFVVLKLDGRTSVGAWSWLIVVVLPLAIAGAAALAWLGLNYFSTLAHELQAEEDINPRDYLKNRRLVNVFSIENYAEAYVFRDSVLFVAFVFFIVFAFLVAATPCTACNTPYKVVAYGAGFGYFIRLILLCYHSVYFFAHFKTMTKEVYSYQHGFDKVGDSRMFNNVIPDLYWEEGWWWSQMIDAGVFVTTIALAALGSIWVSSNACALPCNRLWSYSQYLVAGVFAVEGIYIVTSVLLRYMRRASGVEALQRLFNYIDKADRSTRLDDKPGAYGTKQKAQIAAIRVGRGKLRS